MESWIHDSKRKRDGHLIWVWYDDEMEDLDTFLDNWSPADVAVPNVDWIAVNSPEHDDLFIGTEPSPSRPLHAAWSRLASNRANVTAANIVAMARRRAVRRR